MNQHHHRSYEKRMGKRPEWPASAAAAAKEPSTQLINGRRRLLRPDPARGDIWETCLVNPMSRSSQKIHIAASNHAPASAAGPGGGTARPTNEKLAARHHRIRFHSHFQCYAHSLWFDWIKTYFTDFCTFLNIRICIMRAKNSRVSKFRHSVPRMLDDVT